MDDGIEQVNCLGDIKRVIREFLPGVKHTPLTVKTEMKVDGEIFAVEAESSIDYKKLLLEGFGIVKARLDATQKATESGAKLRIKPFNIEGHMWLDDLIVRRFGGKRDGLRIRWDLEDGTYFFDPYSCKVTKASV